jgi:dimethylargininase
MTLLALTRAVPQSIGECALTHLPRESIDPARAREQHLAYEECLRELGCIVQQVVPMPALADSVFVEDAAVVLPEIAVITRPGAPSRRAELESVAGALGEHRPLVYVEAPATLDGGDVLHMGSRVYVGQSARTNAEGARQLASLLAPFGYEVRTVNVSGCLHLKTGVSEVATRTVLINPDWVQAAAFRDLEKVAVHPAEPFAANALRIGSSVIHAAAHTATRQILENLGIDVRPVEADELAKAEAGVTCCSIIFTADVRSSDGCDDPEPTRTDG